MKIDINTTINLPDNTTFPRTDNIVAHIQEVLVKYELGMIDKNRESIKNEILGEKVGNSYQYEEAYLTYIPYIFKFWHANGTGWTTEELSELWDWLW